jgi:glycosyltransferase involved in cell wall biosynthesis
MKVVYIVSTLKGSGPINILYNIIKYIDRNKFDPTIITLSPEPSGSMIEEFKSLKVPVKKLNLSRLNGILVGLKKLKGILEIEKPDIIHTHGHRADIMATSINIKCPVVSTIHNYPYEDYVMKYGIAIGYPLAFANMSSFRKMHMPISCSKSIKKRIEKHNINTTAIQNGVDQKEFYAVSDMEKKAIREKLDIPLDKKVFLSIGSLIKRKNPELIINAFKKANINSNNSILIILGNGKLKNRCRDLSKNTDDIHIMGHVSNVKDYLRAADFFVSASLSEGLPNTVLESLASGVPVILSDIEQHKEILEFDRKAGMLFRSNDIEALVDILKDVDNQNLLIGDKKLCTELISKHLNAKIMTGNYENVYSKVVSSIAKV